MIGALLEVEMSKKCTQLWGEALFEVNMYKTRHVRTTFGSWDVKKVHTLLARSTFRSQKCKKLRGTEHFWTFRCRFARQAQGIVHLVKSEQNGFKNDGRRDILKRIWKDAFRVAGAVQETCSSEMLGGQGADFLREVAFLEHQIFRFAEMILCVTGAALRMIWHQFSVAGVVL